MTTYWQFHDGWFNGLMLERGDAYLFLETPRHERFVLHAKQVTSLRAGDFVAANIIFDVQSLDERQISLNDVIGAEKDADPVQAELLLQRCRDQKLAMMRINPLYGASAVVIASSFELLSATKH